MSSLSVESGSPGSERPRSGIRAWIIATLCAALALVCGCSALRIGYSAAPDWVYWELDGYVDFNRTQTPQVRDALARWFAWNRRSQLPDYAALLGRMQTEALADTSAARVCEWQSEIVQRLIGAYDAIVPAAADIALTLTPAQFTRLERRYAKLDDEFRDKYLQSDPKKRAQAALERTVDRAESVYGRLDDAQRTQIAETLAQSPFDAERWLAERRRRQAALLQALRKLVADGAGREQAQAALHRYAVQLERSPHEPYRAYSERLSEFNCAFVAALHNRTNAAQRRNAASKLAGWEGDLRALAAAAPAAPVVSE